jgi:excisionase family DNA binding protein
VDDVAPSNGTVQAAPSQHPATAFTLQEAAAILGVSLNTLRRRIDAGQVRAERVERPQGHVWRVYLDGGQHAGPVRGVV